MISSPPLLLPPGSDYRISDLDDLLNRLGESLQLDPTRRTLANERYKSVAEWIESDELFFKPALLNVYPQGSFRIRTTVKPYKRNEFDLDFVAHLDFLTGQNHHAMKVLDQLERRLREHGTYRDMIERKNRCIRITYANDFHMDIMVGCQENYHEQYRIIVPDRKKKDWTGSNPIGYGDWFTGKAKLVRESYDSLLFAHQLRNKEIRLSENLPPEPAYEIKLPLERAVQILKRLRDVYFYDNQDMATASIILTTLAAEAYQGQLSVFDTINGTISYIEQKSRNFYGSLSPFEILNPANPGENFSERWFEDPKIFNTFLGFIKHTHQIWNSLVSAASPVLRESLLEETFGTSRVRRLLGEQRAYTQKVQKSQRLDPFAKAAGLGILGTTSSAKPSFEPAQVQNQPARRAGGNAFLLRSGWHSTGTNYLQQHRIERAYPGIFRTSVRNGILTCTGKLKPTEDCDEYRIRLVYVPGTPPHVFIDSHCIEAHHSIHMYSNNALCLHHPPDVAWKHRTSLAEYTIPWVIEWLVCYELWKLTGKWEGAEFKH